MKTLDQATDEEVRLVFARIDREKAEQARRRTVEGIVAGTFTGDRDLADAVLAAHALSGAEAAVALLRPET